MSVSIKSDREIELMREAGKVLSELHERLKELVLPGVTTYEIDMRCREMIKEYGCEPNFLDYQGFPASVCVSVNEEVVHGIPRRDKVLCEGDIVSLDTGVIYKGYHSDAARTWPVGKIDDESFKLINTAREAFFEGIKYAVSGAHLFDISKAIQKHVEKNKFSVVRDLVGHGIGTHLHEAPEIPNFKPIGRGIKLEKGMTFAIEPMINAGGREIVNTGDGWTWVTRDKSRSAHYENTVLITDSEPEILSLV